MTEHKYWILHSPYPDGTWRGIEKCAMDDDCTGPLLFETCDEAKEFISKRCIDWFAPVKVTLSTPNIRGKLEG